MESLPSILIVLTVIASARALPHKPTATTIGPGSASARGSSSLFDLLFPPRDAAQSKPASDSGSSFLNIPGLAPPAQSSPIQRSSSMFGAIDFSQITRICETMAAANRAKKMGEAVRAAAVQPNDIMGWMDLLRQVEPMPFETMACQMLERLITNPDDFVADLMRMIMPQGTGDLSQFPDFGPQSTTTTTPIPIVITPTPRPTTSGSTRKKS